MSTGDVVLLETIPRNLGIKIAAQKVWFNEPEKLSLLQLFGHFWFSNDSLRFILNCLSM